MFPPSTLSLSFPHPRFCFFSTNSSCASPSPPDTPQDHPLRSLRRLLGFLTFSYPTASTGCRDVVHVTLASPARRALRASLSFLPAPFLPLSFRRGGYPAYTLWSFLSRSRFPTFLRPLLLSHSSHFDGPPTILPSRVHPDRRELLYLLTSPLMSHLELHPAMLADAFSSPRSLPLGGRTIFSLVRPTFAFPLEDVLLYPHPLSRVIRASTWFSVFPPAPHCFPVVTSWTFLRTSAGT